MKVRLNIWVSEMKMKRIVLSTRGRKWQLIDYVKIIWLTGMRGINRRERIGDKWEEVSI